MTLFLTIQPSEWIIVRDAAGHVIGRVSVSRGGRRPRVAFDGFDGFEINRPGIDAQRRPASQDGSRPTRRIATDGTGGGVL